MSTITSNRYIGVDTKKQRTWLHIHVYIDRQIHREIDLKYW